MAGLMDDINMEGLSAQIQAELQIKQFRSFLQQYNSLSEKCFTACVWDFTNRSILTKEDKCVNNCVSKYSKVIQRISERFQEQQMITTENAVSAAQSMGTMPNV